MHPPILKQLEHLSCHVFGVSSQWLFHPHPYRHLHSLTAICVNWLFPFDWDCRFVLTAATAVYWNCSCLQRKFQFRNKKIVSNLRTCASSAWKTMALESAVTNHKILDNTVRPWITRGKQTYAIFFPTTGNPIKENRTHAKRDKHILVQVQETKRKNNAIFQSSSFIS